MVIVNLNYLEELPEISNALNGGKSCSLSVNSINGKVNVKASKGCGPVKKKVTKKGSTTTHTYTAKGSTVSISSSTGQSAAYTSIVSVSRIDLGLDGLDDFLSW